MVLDETLHKPYEKGLHGKIPKSKKKTQFTYIYFEQLVHFQDYTLIVKYLTTDSSTCTLFELGDNVKYLQTDGCHKDIINHALQTYWTTRRQMMENQ